MLIIGHRGARGMKAENTLEALRTGYSAHVDVLEFDVRLTKDKIPVLLHDSFLLRSHKQLGLIHHLTYQQLQERLEGAQNPIPTLEAVLKEFSGQIMLNLELKDRGTAEQIQPILQKFIKKKTDWDAYLFSSFHQSELKVMRQHSKHAQLSLLHSISPFSFLFVDDDLQLDAVGFHRLHLNRVTIDAAKRLGLFIYVYTVNRPETAARLEEIGVDGIVTDLPLQMVRFFTQRARTSEV